MTEEQSVTRGGSDAGGASSSSPNGASSPETPAGGLACLNCVTCRRRLLGKCPARDLTERPPSGPGSAAG
jgi:hypothetical protein